MSTSGSYDFYVTRDDIIRDAMLNIGALDPDEAPTASESQDCARRLNMLCKLWMGRNDFAPGLKVWTRKRGKRLLDRRSNSYSLGPDAQGWTNDLIVTKSVANSASLSNEISVETVTGIATNMTAAIQLDNENMFYSTVLSIAGSVITLSSTYPSASASGNAAFFYSSAAQNPRALEAAVLRDAQFTDQDLRVMTQKTYDALSNKVDPENIGDPTAVYFEEGLVHSTLYLDVGAPNDVGSYIVLTYLEPVQDFDTTLDEPYYPKEWYLPLSWGLAEQIAPMFKSQWTQKMEQLKANALAIAGNKNAEVSDAYFQPGNE